MRGADPNSAKIVKENDTVQFRDPVLIQATRKMAIESLEALLASPKLKVNVTSSPSGATALHMAAARSTFTSPNSRWTHIVKLMITRGANVNARSEIGRTPLHYAVEYAFRNRIIGTCLIDVIRILLDKGASVRAVDKDGRTALHAINELSDNSTKMLTLEKTIVDLFSAYNRGTRSRAKKL